MQISSEDLLGLPCLIHVLQHGKPLAWCRDFSCRIWKQTEDGFQNHGQLEKAQKTWPTSPGVVLISLLYLLYVTLISVLSAVKKKSTCNEKPIGWLHCRSLLWYLKQETCWRCCNLAFLYDSPASLGKYGTKTWGHWISCRYILIDSSFSLKERDFPWVMVFSHEWIWIALENPMVARRNVIFGKTYVQLLC